jgi:hypothetical protein
MKETHFDFSVSLIIGWMPDITWHDKTAATSSPYGRSVSAETSINGLQAVNTSLNTRIPKMV